MLREYPTDTAIPQALVGAAARPAFLCAALKERGLEVLAMGDPAAIRQLARWNPWGADTDENLWCDTPGHTNQIAFDKTAGRVLFSAGDSELVVVDVSEPAAAKALRGHGAPRNKSGVWGSAARGDTAYLAYIKTIVPFRGRELGGGGFRRPTDRRRRARGSCASSRVRCGASGNRRGSSR